MRSLLKKIMGDPSSKEMDAANPIVAAINELEPRYEGVSDEELRSNFQELGKRHRDGESLDD